MTTLEAAYLHRLLWLALSDAATSGQFGAHSEYVYRLHFDYGALN